MILKGKREIDKRSEKWSFSLDSFLSLHTFSSSHAHLRQRTLNKRRYVIWGEAQCCQPIVNFHILHILAKDISQHQTWGGAEGAGEPAGEAAEGALFIFFNAYFSLQVHRILNFHTLLPTFLPFINIFVLFLSWVRLGKECGSEVSRMFTIFS